MDDELRKQLQHFKSESVPLQKGPLSLVLILTRNARERAFPLSQKDFVTAEGGQVAGAGGGALRRILSEHGVTRLLSSEGGRTSRGSLAKMRAYVDFLNMLHSKGLITGESLKEVEEYWVGRINDYFQSQPFTLNLDASKSIRQCVRDLLAQAMKRQKEAHGTMYHGAVMQHLVGAKLDLLTNGVIKHHAVAVADAVSGRGGDFAHGDVVIHVSTAPGQPLIEKCQSNLNSGLKPVIVTTEDGQGGAKAAARQAGLEDRIDVLEIEQFLATNLYEWSQFSGEQRPVKVAELIERYNKIVQACEHDQSLRIDFDGG